MKYQNLDSEKVERKRSEVEKDMNDLSHYRLLQEYMKLYDERNEALDRLIGVCQELNRYIDLYAQAQAELEKLRGEKQ